MSGWHRISARVIFEDNESISVQSASDCLDESAASYDITVKLLSTASDVPSISGRPVFDQWKCARDIFKMNSLCFPSSVIILLVFPLFFTTNLADHCVNQFAWLSPTTICKDWIGVSRNDLSLRGREFVLPAKTCLSIPKLRRHPLHCKSASLSKDVAPSLSPPGRSVGVDLGTTNSAVAAVRDGQPFIIPNALGQPTTPSVVSYVLDTAGNVTVLVGSEAEAQADANPAGTFASVKRVIGRKRAEIAGSNVSPGLRGALEQGERGDLLLRCPAAGRSLRPEEVSAEVARLPLPSSTPPAPLPPKRTSTCRRGGGGGGGGGGR